MRVRVRVRLRLRGRVSGHLDVVRREHLGRALGEQARWRAAHTYYYLSESYVLDVVPLTPHLGGEPLARRVAVGDEAGGPHRRHHLGRQGGLLLALLAHLVRARVRVRG